LEDILDHEMIKWSKLYLDNAQASWAMPGKENDFFITWKNLALHDSLFTKNHKKIIKNLPNDAVNALNEMLLKLEISEAEYTEYFERHLL
ncbi:putative inorganic carbon transporter subunit DabA, partial [Staphylococcus capitis]